MAARKPKVPTPMEDGQTLPNNNEGAESDEQAWEALRRIPGVIVHRRDDALAKQFEPLKTTGTMSMAELRWMLGRIDDDELEEEIEAERRAATNRAS